jgi:hypothetical protein
MCGSTLPSTSALDGGWSAPRPRPLEPPSQKKPSTHCTRGWVGPTAALNGCGKSRPTGIRFPDRRARSESLYRLNYRGYVVGFTITKHYSLLALQQWSQFYNTKTLQPTDLTTMEPTGSNKRCFPDQITDRKERKDLLPYTELHKCQAPGRRGN